MNMPKTNLPRSGPDDEGPPDIQWVLDQTVAFYLKHGGPEAARRHLMQLAATLSFIDGWTQAYCKAMDSIEQLTAPPPPPKPLLTEQLSTPQAMAFWQRLQDAQLVDADYNPLTSRTEAAIIAFEMGKRLNIQHIWKTFEALWYRNNMRADYNKGMNQTRTRELLDTLKKILEC